MKEYIKRAKYWKKEKVEWPNGKAGCPSSFLMSLLVIEAFRRSSIPERGIIPQREKKKAIRRYITKINQV